MHKCALKRISVFYFLQKKVDVMYKINSKYISQDSLKKQTL